MVTTPLLKKGTQRGKKDERRCARLSPKKGESFKEKFGKTETREKRMAEPGRLMYWQKKNSRKWNKRNYVNCGPHTVCADKGRKERGEELGPGG